MAVVGAGPAGMAAAVAAARAGVDVTVVDGYGRPGGQYFRQLPESFEAVERTAHGRRADAVLGDLVASGARVLTSTTVWGAFPESEGGWQLALYGPGGVGVLHAQALILATGAYDRPVPFPGWTLPGVMTAGGVQLLLKSQRVLPGRRLLLAGAGPLQWAVAAGLVRAGAEVVALLEGAAPGLRALRHLPALWGQWQRLAEGWGYWRTLAAARVPLKPGWGLVEVHGREQVEEAVIAPLDAAWHPVRARQMTVAADTVVIGYGLVSAVELARLLGCVLDYRPAEGGYVPRRDAHMQTSLPGVYAVGDGAGIGGAELAQIEGRIAGIAAALRLGRLSERAAQAAIREEQGSLAREQRFARMLGALFGPRTGLFELADDTTVVCRCEDVTLGEIRRAVAGGATDVNEVKGLTRAGMGNCQGRICGDLVAHAIVLERTGRADDQGALLAAGRLTVRPPIHPLLLELLAGWGEGVAARSGDGAAG